MKFKVLLLLVAVCHAIDLQSQNNKENISDKRELSKSNSGVDKRAPTISTVSPAITPGVEYADSKESQQDKSPTHQIYATPLPPVSKISDVLAGQGPGFQSAIASHLYAPVSVYQPRLGSPTVYEVSAPVPSNLAYAEHRVSMEPSQNAIQITQKPLQKFKDNQQILIQQPFGYSQNVGPIAQPNFQQIPQIHYQEIPINQFQIPLYSGQQPLYQGQQIQIAQAIQPVNTYSPGPQQEKHHPTQRELKPQPGSKTTEKQVANQNYVQPQGAVSFTKYSQLQPAALQPQQEIQYQLQPQPQQQPQYQQPPLQYQQLQYQPQPPQYQILQQPQIQYQSAQQYQLLPQVNQAHVPPVQYQLQPEQALQQSQPQIQYHSQPHLPLKHQLVLQPQNQLLPQPQHQSLQQPQYQPVQQPQHQPQHQPLPQPQQQIQLQPISKATNVGKISLLRPGPVFLQSQYQQGQETQDYRSNVALPTFPPVQYYGKYAQSIFGNLHH